MQWNTARRQHSHSLSLSVLL